MTAKHSDDDSDDRRILERRWQDRVTERLSEAEGRIGKLELRLDMLIATVNSRHEALQGGQRQLDTRVDALEAIKDRIVGAYTLVIVLGVSGVIGGIAAIVKLVKGP